MDNEPAFTSRAIYLASQGKNSYERLPQGACAEMLRELAHWGYNEYWFSFDRSQYCDIFDHRISDAAGRTVWEKQKEMAEVSRRLAMKVTLVSPVNVIYRNQAEGEDLLAEIQGAPGEAPAVTELGCPSKLRGREIVLRNYRNLFSDLKYLDGVCLTAYADGGCHCRKCHPWVKTFIELSSEIAAILSECHPNAQLLISDARFTDKEVTAIAQYLKQKSPAWLHGIVKSDRHSPDQWSKHDLPIHYRQTAFLDISKPGGWGVFGANPTPRRIQSQLAELREHGFDNIVAYSGELHDDLNKIFIAKFACAPSESLQGLCQQYARRYLDESAGPALYELILMMEAGWTPPAAPWYSQVLEPTPDDSADLLRTIEEAEGSLSNAAQAGWRWALIRHRARIGELLLKIGTQDALLRAVESTTQSAATSASRPDLLNAIRKARDCVQDRASSLDELRKEIEELRSRTLALEEDRWPRFGVSSNLFEGRWGQTWSSWRVRLLELETWLDGCANERSVAAIRSRLEDAPRQ